MQFFQETFYENPIWLWFVALGIILFVGLVLRLLMRVLVRRLKRFASKTPGRLDDLLVEMLAKTRFLFVLVVSFYAGSLLLVLPGSAETALRALFVVALLFQVGYWGDGLISFWIRRTVRRKLDQDPSTATSLSAIGFVAKIAIWVIVLLLALENLGIDITMLITTLGIGGIAIALAVQNILGDLFASLSIIVDKPFVIGDFIVVGDQMGNVERIGLKTTRVRSLSGEQIIFSNSDLLSSRVRNYKRMYERRIVFGFGVVYGTPVDVVETIPGTVRDIIESQSNVRFDRCHFNSFGDSALDFETVYYVLVSDYNVYMDVQQAINLAIMRAFEQRGIEFAYPTQTLYVRRSEPLEDE
ncbi:mechanosensitive ion channel family protein [Candidatus Bipolaricaulota bacterium]|nr:mechanosensitive ion channel family protein [Candidatus Bipolaricaulota bacterium]